MEEEECVCVHLELVDVQAAALDDVRVLDRLAGGGKQRLRDGSP